jgi:carbon storage regulator
MLVLTRKENEKIRIGDDIVITVVRTGDRVRLGIEAPGNMVVLRDELTKKEEPDASLDKISKTSANPVEALRELSKLRIAG